MFHFHQSILVAVYLQFILLVEAQESYTVFTYAGTGSTAIANGQRTTATFNEPYAIVFDSADNMYVSEVVGSRIRKITPVGVVSNFLGTGTLSSVDGPLASATVNTPHGLAVDAGDNLFFIDYGANKVRKVNLTSNIVSTFAGSGAAGFVNGFGTYATFSGPIGLAIDVNSTLFVGDRDNHAIRKISSG